MEEADGGEVLSDSEREMVDLFMGWETAGACQPQ